MKDTYVRNSHSVQGEGVNNQYRRFLPKVIGTSNRKGEVRAISWRTNSRIHTVGIKRLEQDLRHRFLKISP